MLLIVLSVTACEGLKSSKSGDPKQSDSPSAKRDDGKDSKGNKDTSKKIIEDKKDDKDVVEVKNEVVDDMIKDLYEAAGLKKALLPPFPSFALTFSIFFLLFLLFYIFCGC